MEVEDINVYVQRLRTNPSELKMLEAAYNRQKISRKELMRISGLGTEGLFKSHLSAMLSLKLIENSDYGHYRITATGKAAYENVTNKKQMSLI